MSQSDQPKDFAKEEVEQTQTSSYRQIFKATGIVGGAQVATILIGIARNKTMALLLGPSGVGLAGTYLTVTGMIGGITQLGIGPSGVRQIAEASGSDDQEQVARTALTLRRISLFSGLLGLVAGLALSSPLSHLTFGDTGHTADLMLLSLTLMVGSISAGQWALLQGLRRLGDLAKSQIWGAFWGAAGSIGIVFLWREQGIAPYLVVNALITLWFSRWYARKVPLETYTLSWRETWQEARGVISLGTAFVFQNLTLGAGAYLTRLLIIDHLGLAAVGLFTASFTLSTYYVQLILKAMNTDFYPRLTAVAEDRSTVNQMVNEQIEMGVLMATPGVLGIVALAPWALETLYSSDFIAATSVIRWMILGVFIQILTWPVGTIILAKGRKQIFMGSQVLSMVLDLTFLALLLPLFGLEGIGIGSACGRFIYGAFILGVGTRVLGFMFNRRALFTTGLASLVVVGAICVSQVLEPGPALAFGMVLTVGGTLASAVLLNRRLGINVFQILQRTRKK